MLVRLLVVDYQCSEGYHCFTRVLRSPRGCWSSSKHQFNYDVTAQCSFTLPIFMKLWRASPRRSTLASYWVQHHIYATEPLCRPTGHSWARDSGGGIPWIWLVDADSVGLPQALLFDIVRNVWPFTFNPIYPSLSSKFLYVARVIEQAINLIYLAISGGGGGGRGSGR
ncbi:hypothetical protein B0H16DRAFT_1507015 [Mycena metata]|uniref:Uncharacterized protein n=1 Tax=Mycena metata TaxID=1033252 RepID=A0AAD7JZY8_9AGAR|nr:hypothetical protein B0H16DRAFT_1507015 [Mycena metata]